MLDFGLVRCVDDVAAIFICELFLSCVWFDFIFELELFQSNDSVKGMLRYMVFEQWLGVKFDGVVDVWVLGFILYELCSG